MGRVKVGGYGEAAGAATVEGGAKRLLSSLLEYG